MIEGEPSGIKSLINPGLAMYTSTSHDLTRTTLGVLIIGVLIVASLWTMQAFIGPLVWATAIVVATWPLAIGYSVTSGNSRGWATTVMVLVMIVIFVVPFGPRWAQCSRRRRTESMSSFLSQEWPGPPPHGLPVFRSRWRLTAEWRRLCPPPDRKSSPRRSGPTSSPWLRGSWR